MYPHEKEYEKDSVDSTLFWIDYVLNANMGGTAILEPMREVVNKDGIHLIQRPWGPRLGKCVLCIPIIV